MADPTLNLSQPAQQSNNPAGGVTIDPRYNLLDGVTPPPLDLSQIGKKPLDLSKIGASPSYSGLKGVFLNQDSPLNLQNIGGTVAMAGTDAIGALLAPETGGLSLAGALALSSGLGAAGSVAGKAAQNKLTGQDVTSGLGGAALSGGAGGLGGEALGKGVGTVLSKAGDYASSLLTSKGEGLALSSLGVTNAAARNWGAANKEALSDFVTRTGQIGATPEKVAATAEEWGKAYNDIARQSGVKVPVSDIGSSLQQAIDAEGQKGTSAGQAFIQRLKAERDTVLASMHPDVDGKVDIGQLADLKSELQRTAYGNRATNPTGVNDVEQTLADSLMGKLNEVARTNGLTAPDGRSLEELGKDLQKQSRLNSLAQKSAYASPDASKPINTGKIIRAGAGGGAGFIAGGPVGAAIGTVAEPIIEAAANSPAALKALSGAATSAAPVAENALKTAGENIASPAGRAAVGGAGMGAISSANPSGPLLSAVPSTGSAETASASTGDPVADGVAAMQKGVPLTQSQYQALLQKDLTSTGGRFSTQITAAYNAGNPAGVQSLATAQGVTNSLADLYNQAGGGKGLIGGNIENALAPVTKGSANSYNQQKLALGQEIISQIYGSTGTAADRDQVLGLIPDLNDSPQNAAQKMAQLRSLIQTRLSSMTSSTPGSVAMGSGGPSLTL